MGAGAITGGALPLTCCGGWKGGNFVSKTCTLYQVLRWAEQVRALLELNVVSPKKSWVHSADGATEDVRSQGSGWFKATQGIRDGSQPTGQVSVLPSSCTAMLGPLASSPPLQERSDETALEALARPRLTPMRAGLGLAHWHLSGCHLTLRVGPGLFWNNWTSLPESQGGQEKQQVWVSGQQVAVVQHSPPSNPGLPPFVPLPRAMATFTHHSSLFC